MDTQMADNIITHMPDSVWTPLIQAITLHTDWNPEYWRFGSLFPVSEFQWQQGLTPWSDWQVNHHRIELILL
jgi:hypothetical protein